jgi:antitoxin VapB
MKTAKIFKAGCSQAVRLPKEFRFDTDEVCVARVDDMIILYPHKKAWDFLERGIRHFTKDFMADRSQPARADKRGKL